LPVSPYCRPLYRKGGEKARNDGNAKPLRFLPALDIAGGTDIYSSLSLSPYSFGSTDEPTGGWNFEMTAQATTIEQRITGTRQGAGLSVVRDFLPLSLLGLRLIRP